MSFPNPSSRPAPNAVERALIQAALLNSSAKSADHE